MKSPKLTFRDALDYLNLMRSQYPGLSIDDMIEHSEEIDSEVDANALSEALDVIRSYKENSDFPPEEEYEEPPPSLVRHMILNPKTKHEEYINLMAHYQNILTLYAIIQLVEQEYKINHKQISNIAMYDINDLAQAISERESQRKTNKAFKEAQNRAKKNHKPIPTTPKIKHLTARTALNNAVNNSYLIHGQQTIDATLQQEVDPQAAQYELYRLEREILDTEDSNNANCLRKMSEMATKAIQILKERYK